MFLVLSPVKAVVFMIVQQGLFGLYLGCSFAPNHKGMPILDAADQSDFLRRQAITSRNVRSGWLTDLALGGLNYQIEHPRLPSMPRPNLRRSQALIGAFCRAARFALPAEQPGGFLCPGAASPQCRGQASPPGSGDLSGGPLGSLPHAPPTAGGDCLAESTGVGGMLGVSDVSAAAQVWPVRAKPVPAAPAPPEGRCWPPARPVTAAWTVGEDVDAGPRAG